MAWKYGKKPKYLYSKENDTFILYRQFDMHLVLSTSIHMHNKS